MMKIAVIGGVAGGAGAAARAKRINPQARITIYEAGSHIAYGSCGIPYYISGEIQEITSLIGFTPSSFQEKKQVEVRIKHRVQALNLQKKSLQIEDIQGNRQLEETYDRLIIATGAQPFVPPLPGKDKEGVFTLRSVEDAPAIRQAVERRKGQDTLIIGGGAIGVEMAEAFVTQGQNVLLLEKAPQILPFMDEDMALLVQNHLEEKGVEVRTGEGVSRFLGNEHVEAVETDLGNRFPIDLALLSIGVRPQVDLAREAGLALGETGALSVDATMATSHPHVYGAGDCCEALHRITGKQVWMPLGSTANKQARVAGASVAGGKARFLGVQGTAILKALDLHVGRTGLSSREAEAEGLEYYTSTITGYSNARYYPQWATLQIKLIVGGDDVLLGAQVVGRGGVDKRLDVLATAIHHRMKVEELMDLDLSYAPPYNQPLDPLMVAGNVAARRQK